MSESSIGNAPVSVSYFNARQTWPHRGAVEIPLDSKPGLDFAFDKPLGYRRHREKIEMEIAVNW